MLSETLGATSAARGKRALLPETASVECIRLNKHGYTARGRYHGRTGERLYRLTDTEAALDFVTRAKDRREAVAMLAQAIRVSHERYAYWQTRCERTPLETALDHDKRCARYAERDALASLDGFGR